MPPNLLSRQIKHLFFKQAFLSWCCCLHQLRYCSYKLPRALWKALPCSLKSLPLSRRCPVILCHLWSWGGTRITLLWFFFAAYAARWSARSFSFVFQCVFSLSQLLACLRFSCWASCAAVSLHVVRRDSLVSFFFSLDAAFLAAPCALYSFFASSDSWLWYLLHLSLFFCLYSSCLVGSCFLLWR